ncbi:MAG: phosphopyruvate hydratase [Isosphaeraceae bacterium]
MATLRRLLAREVLDSRGRPTVEVEAWGSDGSKGRATVPSGASTGRHEALELRDGDPSRFAGKGVLHACRNVREAIQPELLDRDLQDQAGIDAAMIALDGMPNKGKLGANAILGASMAIAHAAAASRGEPLFEYLHRLRSGRPEPGDPPARPACLPMPMVNLISGGLHAGRKLDLQDFLMIPVGARSYSEALAMTADVYRSLGEVLRGHGEEGDLVGDEGGYGPALSGNREALDRLMEAFRRAGLEPGRDVAIAIDVASTHFFEPSTGLYTLKAEGGGPIESGRIVDLLESWTRDYPIVSIEDGLAEDDFEGWATLTNRQGKSAQLIGDDLFATQVGRLRDGIERGIANAILIKLNQVGTLTETFEALSMARRHGYRTVVSARSGETEDTTIADLAVASSAGQIKIGSIVRSERLAKYNQLLRIEEALGGPDLAPFAGFRPPG